MKRFVAIASCILIALAGCTKPQQQDNSTLDTPVNKSYHASLTLTDQSFEASQKAGIVPRTISLTSGGKFLLGFYDTEAANPETARLKYKSGIYSVTSSKAPSAGLVFNFPMFGDLIINKGSGSNWDISYIPPAGTTYNGSALLDTDNLSGFTADNLCRSWRPTELIVSASGDGMAAIVGKKFSNDINEIITYLNSKGMKLNPDDYSQYTLESIDYTENGLLLINFKDFAISPFVGNFTLKDSNDDNVAYNFNLAWEDNLMIPVSGLGSVTVTDNQMTLYTESDATLREKKYHIAVSIISTAIK